MQTYNQTKYINDIEILRAFAIILVLFHHFEIILLFFKVPDAIYLIHIPVFLFVEEFFAPYIPNFEQHDQRLFLMTLASVACLGITFIISELNFRSIEQPFRKKGRLIAKNYIRIH